MRVGFEAKRYFFNESGLGNYARTLIASLSGKAGFESVLYSPARYSSQLRHTGLLTISGPGPLWRNFWQWNRWKSDGIQVYHGLSNELPFGCQWSGVPTVVTVHDLLFIRHPHLYPLIDRIVYNIKTRYACRVANEIVAVSEETRQDLIRLLGIAPQRIKVIYQGCGARFHRAIASDEIQGRLDARGLTHKGFVLHVGTISERKGQERLIRSMVEWEGTLVLAGRGPRDAVEHLESLIEQLGLRERVRLLSDVDDDELPALYTGAAMFVYPSIDEGFGIPIIEALSCGATVLTADRPAMREAGGPISHYCDPTDPVAIGKMIKRLVAENDRLDQEAWKAHLRLFEVELIVAKWTDIYARLTTT